jgi:SOS-response transcriptional repressor LexA
MNIKGLILRELAEGLTEKELASAIGVAEETLVNILVDKFPVDSVSWEIFSKYFRMDVDVLRTGGSTHSITILNLSDLVRQSKAGLIRKIPLLEWDQMGQLILSKDFPDIIHASATIDTIDISGKRTVAVKVQDDSMETMFSQGELILVDPDSTWESGDYVVVHHPNMHPDTILLRQVKFSENQCMLHPLNRKYQSIPLTQRDKVWGKVVRLTKSL